MLNDISVGGMSFHTREILPQDSLMSLDLKIGDMIRIGDIYGRVARISKTACGEYDIGINFSWWGRDEDKKNLTRLISEELPSAGN